MSEEGEVTLYPPWEEALRRFVDAGFKPGDIVRREWLYSAFGLDMPTDATPKGIADRMELAFLAQYAPFREHLLEAYKVDLRTKPGAGWEVVHPFDQTRLAVRDGAGEIRKALGRMIRRVVHVDQAALTDAQRSENMDTQVRLQRLSQMLRREGRQLLPPPE